MNKYLACRIGVTAAVIIAVAFAIVTIALNPFNITPPDLSSEFAQAIAISAIISVMAAFISIVNLWVPGEEATMFKLILTTPVSLMYSTLFITASDVPPITKVTLVVCIIAMITTLIVRPVYNHISKPVCKRVWRG